MIWKSQIPVRFSVLDDQRALRLTSSNTPHPSRCPAALLTCRVAAGRTEEHWAPPQSLSSAVLSLPWLCLGVSPEMRLVFTYFFSLLHIVSCTQENFPNCRNRLQSSAITGGWRGILHQWMLIKNWLSF